MSASDANSSNANSSEATPREFTGRSTAADPADAVRDALAAIGRQLAAAGLGPHHMTAMTWTVPDLTAFDPALRSIDLAYREIFVGFKPPLTRIRAADDGLTITAQAAAPASPDPRPIWRGYSAADLAAQYSARAQVPDMRAVFAKWWVDGNAFRLRHSALDIACGPAPAQRLDIYRPADAVAPPVFVYIHGGYWQSVGREQNAQFAEGLVRSGFAVANLDYGLAPETKIADIYPQIRQALNFLVAESAALGIDVARMHIAGHSAGGHLAAIAVADPQAPPLRSALLISGLFELAPLALLPMGRVLALDDEATIATNSPMRLRPRAGTRVALALGAGETDEFKWQSRQLADLWHAPSPLIVDGTHHFDVLETLRAGALLDLALRD